MLFAQSTRQNQSHLLDLSSHGQRRSNVQRRTEGIRRKAPQRPSQPSARLLPSLEEEPDMLRNKEDMLHTKHPLDHSLPQEPHRHRRRRA